MKKKTKKEEVVYVEICKNCRTPEFEKIIAKEKLKQHRERKSDEFSIDYVVAPKDNGKVAEKKKSFIKSLLDNLKCFIP